MTGALQLISHVRGLFAHCRFKIAALVRKIPFVSSLFICLVLAGIVAGTTELFYNRDVQYALLQIPPASDGVALIGYGYRLDLTSPTTLTIGWNIIGCGVYELVAHPKFWELEGCNMLNRAVDIYFNGTTTPTFSYDPAKLPLIPTSEPRFLYTISAFEVEHGLDFGYRDEAPFDSYNFHASVFVIEKATNKSVPIVAFAAGEGPENFIVLSTNEPTESFFTSDNGTGPNTVLVESSVVSVVVKRSQFARAFTLCLFLVNWALTVGSVYITLLVLVRTGKMDPAVVLLPVTLVLTIPTLRNLYVGSPPFGIYIDTLGFFLQMMIVAVSSMILLYRIGIPDPCRSGQLSGNDENP